MNGRKSCNMYRDILNVDAAFGIFPNTERDRCIVIGRSSIEGIDIGAIMRSMGGGGHPGAGSALRESVVTESVEKEIIDLIQGNHKVAVQMSDLMSFPVLKVQSDTPMKAVAKILREKGCTGVPVVEGEKLVGIISRRDFRRIKRESQLSSPVKAFMSREVQTVEPGMGPMRAARLMVKHDIGRLPVVEDGSSESLPDPIPCGITMTCYRNSSGTITKVNVIARILEISDTIKQE